MACPFFIGGSLAWTTRRCYNIQALENQGGENGNRFYEASGNDARQL